MTALALMAALLAAADVSAAAAPEEPPAAGGTYGMAPSETILVPRKRSETGPWLELDAGPTWLHHSGIRGLEDGPQVRFAIGTSLTDRIAAELWLSGALQSSNSSGLGSEGAAGGGLGARFLLHQFDADGRLQIFAHAGAGYMASTTTLTVNSPHGAAGFAGALLLLQPPVRRFAFGLELDATAIGSAYGFAVLPTLRCGL